MTNERIIIVSGLFTAQTTSISLRTLTDVSLSERSNGAGTITFGPANRSPFGAWGGQGIPGAAALGPRFDWIENARSVFDIITQAQRLKG